MEAKDDDASAGYNDFYKGIVEADEEQKLLRQPEEWKAVQKGSLQMYRIFTGAEAKARFRFHWKTRQDSGKRSAAHKRGVFLQTGGAITEWKQR